MSIVARGGCALAGAAMVLGLAPAATAQDNGAVLNILVECAKIDDPSARLACFDNNIRSAGGKARNTVPGAIAGLSGGKAPVAPSAGFGGESLRREAPARAEGFGGESIRTAERFEQSGPDSMTATVTGAQMREQGVYLLTLQDNSQWLFAEDADQFYKEPRAGSKVVIQRGALGSYLARVDGQRPIRVRRVR